MLVRREGNVVLVPNITMGAKFWIDGIGGIGRYSWVFK
jgi:hypothetical protein